MNDFSVSEYDYHQQNFSPETGHGPRDCRIYMIVNDDWKYIHAPGFDPVLFDRKKDPQEFNDLGRSPDHVDARAEMHELLANWALQYRQRETYDDATAARFTGFEEKAGILIGYWDENDLIDPANAPKTTDQPKL